MQRIRSATRSLRSPWGSLGFVLCALWCTGAVLYWQMAPIPKIRVRGVPLELSRIHIPSWATDYARRWLDEPITIDAGRVVTHASRRSLGAQLQVDTLRAQTAGLHLHHLLLRAWIQGTPASLAWQASVDRKQLLRFLETVRRNAARLPEPQSFNSEGQLVGGAPGWTFGPARAADHVRAVLLRELTYARIRGQVIAPPAPHLPLETSATFSEKIAEHTSSFARYGDAWGRAQNIKRAVQEIDGAIIPPHRIFSFNQQVGERSFGRGFMPAREIANKEYIDGIGGGVCQVATALHAAARDAGFTMVEHHPHSLAVQYASPETDTAVAWPSKDLRIRNPYRFHVRVRATARGGRLNLQLEGAQHHPPRRNHEPN